MAKLSPNSVARLKHAADFSQRHSGGIGQAEWRAIHMSVPIHTGEVRSGPDADGLYTGRLAKFDGNQSDVWSYNDTDVLFQSVNGEPLRIGRRYPCRPSYVYPGTGSAPEGLTTYETYTDTQVFVEIEESLGTGTWNIQGRSIASLVTYNATTDIWTKLPGLVLVEPLNPGTFIAGRRYPAWYAGEATGGYDGTGTGTLGTGTGTAGGTTPVYIANPEGSTLDVVTGVSVQCVNGSIVMTVTKRTIICIQV